MNSCDTLQQCVLRNLGTGIDTLLVPSPSTNLYTIESSNAIGFSIRCDINKIPNATDIALVQFVYDTDNKTSDLFGAPHWMFGSSGGGSFVVPVPYLSSCNSGIGSNNNSSTLIYKTVTVQGHAWAGQCFGAFFSLTATCPSVPVAPVLPPTAPTAPMAPKGSVAPPTKPPNAWKPPPPKTCPQGYKLTSLMYCVLESCQTDYQCPVNSNRIPYQDCYSSMNQCACLSGYEKKNSNSCQRKRLSKCRWGRRFWFLGACQAPPNAGVMEQGDSSIGSHTAATATTDAPP